MLPDYWLFIIPGILLGLYAQIKLSSTYGKYSKLGIRSGATGAEAARTILDSAGLTSMPVREIRGHLTDHYDPAKKALFLSSDNYHGNSMAAVGVAAHEAGHALQNQAAYAPLNLRMAIVPVTNFASMAYIPLILFGMITHAFQVVLPLIIAVFSIITLFQLITLPVEFDASRRAKEQLVRLGIVRNDEAAGVSRVLNAAAMTYVAAMITSALQLVYYLMIARDR